MACPLPVFCPARLPTAMSTSSTWILRVNGPQQARAPRKRCDRHGPSDRRLRLRPAQTLDGCPFSISTLSMHHKLRSQSDYGCRKARGSRGGFDAWKSYKHSFETCGLHCCAAITIMNITVCLAVGLLRDGILTQTQTLELMNRRMRLLRSMGFCKAVQKQDSSYAARPLSQTRLWLSDNVFLAFQGYTKLQNSPPKQHTCCLHSFRPTSSSPPPVLKLMQVTKPLINLRVEIWGILGYCDTM